MKAFPSFSFLFMWRAVEHQHLKISWDFRLWILSGSEPVCVFCSWLLAGCHHRFHSPPCLSSILPPADLLLIGPSPPHLDSGVERPSDSLPPLQNAMLPHGIYSSSQSQHQSDLVCPSLSPHLHNPVSATLSQLLCHVTSLEHAINTLGLTMWFSPELWTLSSCYWSASFPARFLPSTSSHCK